jgi:hypothetical protein
MQTTSTTPGVAAPASEDRYGIATTSVPTTTTPAVVPPVTTPVAPISTPQSTVATATPSVVAPTVRIEAPAGQYRPGGTSSYTGTPTTPVEVASRPTTPSPTAAPLPSNVPIYPAGNVRTY